jgi:hypothetical protein
MVPKEITEEQKQSRVTICQELLERQDEVLGRNITDDETWGYQYDLETKRQSLQRNAANSPLPKRFLQSKSRAKIHLHLLSALSLKRPIHYQLN